MIKKILFVTTLSLALAPGAAFAAWVLDGGRSAINFVSVKKGKVGEVHSFKSISGTIKKNGNAKVVITLSSVATGIAVRNKRMGKLLFETGKYPLATISAKLDADALKGGAIGSVMRYKLRFTLDMHGVKKDMSAKVIVTRLAKDAVSVVTAKPVIVRAGDFNMKDGVMALQKVAKLPSIAVVVPTTFHLVFSRK